MDAVLDCPSAETTEVKPEGFPKMNPAVKEMWVTALRSGKYKQGRDMLNACNEMCCLGVLCDIYDPSGWIGDPDSECYSFLYSPNIGKSVDIYPPLEVLDWASLSNDVQLHLAELNDNRGLTFNQIADWIEANL